MLHLCCAGIAFSQTAFDSLYVTDGGVRTVAVSGNTIYIGGSSTSVEPHTGADAIVDNSTGIIDPSFPKIDESVRSIITTGSDSWSLSNDFTSAGAGKRDRIEHSKHVLFDKNMRHRRKESFQSEAVFPHEFKKEGYPLINGLAKQATSYNSTRLSNSIDTAVVYGITDTTRYSYTFTASGKHLSQVSEKLENENWVKNSRTTYIYDETGREVSEIVEQWKNGQWENVIRYTWIYSTKENTLSSSYEKWINRQWENAFRYTYTYNAEGKILTDLSEHWINEHWEKSDRYSYSYNGNVVILLYEYWIDEQFEYSYRLTYTYNESGKIISSVSEEQINSQWINYDRTTYTYDNNGNEISSVQEVWKNEQWENLERHLFTYDDHGNKLSDLLEQWVAQQWESYVLFTFMYDANGNQISFFYERWISGQRENFFRGSSVYDGKGNHLSDLTEQWKNGQWENYTRYSYTYDDDNNITFLSADLWLNGSWERANYPLNIADSAGNYYSFSGARIFLHYKQTVTDVALNDSKIPSSYQLHQNYPNPFNPSTTISYQLPENSHVTLKVYDAIGREVATLVNEVKEAGNYKVKFDASKLSSGVYFYMLRAGNFLSTQKMILLK